MSWENELVTHVNGKNSTIPMWGVLIYSNQHAHFKRMLSNEDYWEALNELTGSSWNIFSIRAVEGSFGIERPKTGLGSMIRVWKEPSENNELLRFFELDSTEHLPSIVVFAVEEDTLHQCVIPISDESEEGSFNELRETVRRINEAVTNVGEDYTSDKMAYFRVVKIAMDNLAKRKRMKKTYSMVKEIRDWLPL